MPIFLVMAGHFVAKGRADVGAWPFLKQRWKRLVVPMLTIGPVILAADLYIWLTGWVIDGKISVRKMQSLAFDHGEDEHLWGTGHLWFLQYLFLYSCIWIIVRKPLRKRITSGSAAGLSIAACASLAAVTVYCEPWVAFGFQHDWLPVPSKWLYCGAFFSMGVLLAHAPRQGPLRPAVELGHLGSRNRQRARDRAGRIARVSSAAWNRTRSLVGRDRGGNLVEHARPSERFESPEHALSLQAGSYSILRALSFWVYLLHHPFVGLSHVTLHVALVDLSPALKMTIAFGVSVTLSLSKLRNGDACLAGTLGHTRAVGWSARFPNHAGAPSREGNRKLSAGGDAASTLHVQIGKRAA